MLKGGMMPAVVKSYNAELKTCEVTMEGMTSGANSSIIAKIAFPVGDKGRHTDIRIVAGDRVWVMFEGGDMRHPIVTHFRNHDSGNAQDWRKFHHTNIELTASGILVIKASSVQIEGAVSIKGNAQIEGGLKNNGANVGSDHTHSGVQSGGSNTGTPA